MNRTTVPTPAGSRWTARRRLAAATAVAAVAATTSALSGAAADRPRFEDLELTFTGGYYTAEALTRDSDGDGWSDWYERLQGTDPKDPASHPEHARLEIEGTTGFVQSTSFPDRLAFTDLAVPEGKSVTMNALDLVGRFGGLSPTGKLHDELTGMLEELGGSGRLADMLAEADSFRGTKDQPARTGSGFDLSLVADRDVSTVVGGQNVTVGTRQGNPYVQINDGVNQQIHVRTERGTDSQVSEIINLDDGAYLKRTSYFHDGKATGSSLLKRNPETGEETLIRYDADGNVISKEYTPPTKSAGATPSQGATPTKSAGQPSSSGSSESSSSSSSSSASSDGKTTEAAPSSTPTATNTYSDPNADPVYAPSPEEVAARLAFLSGVRTRFSAKKPELDPSKLVPAPGVADPAEPDCDKAGCVYFVEVHAPRLGNVNGGDPVPPDLLPR